MGPAVVLDEGAADVPVIGFEPLPEDLGVDPCFAADVPLSLPSRDPTTPERHTNTPTETTNKRATSRRNP